MSCSAAITSVNNLSSGEVSDSESESPAAVITGRQVCVSRKTCIAHRSLTSDHSSLSCIFSSSRRTSANAWSLQDFSITSLKCFRVAPLYSLPFVSLAVTNYSFTVGQWSGSRSVRLCSDFLDFRIFWRPKTMSSFSPCRTFLSIDGAFRESMYKAHPMSILPSCHFKMYPFNQALSVLVTELASTRAVR